MSRLSLIGFLSLFFLKTAVGIPLEAESPKRNESLLSAYHAVLVPLSKSNFKEAKQQAQELSQEAREWISHAESKRGQSNHVKRMLEGAEELSNASEKSEFIKRFGKLSEGVVQFVDEDKSVPPLKSRWKLYHCRLGSAYQYWIQPITDLQMRNPYLGVTDEVTWPGKPGPG